MLSSARRCASLEREPRRQKGAGAGGCRPGAFLRTQIAAKIAVTLPVVRAVLQAARDELLASGDVVRHYLGITHAA